jgi:hypothetical protein
MPEDGSAARVWDLALGTEAPNSDEGKPADSKPAAMVASAGAMLKPHR